MLMKLRPVILSAAALSVLAVGSALAGETITYRGTGTYRATHSLLPLAHGGAVVHLANETVATIEPSEPGFIFGDCAGLGYMTVDGTMTAVESYCTFRESEQDAFDIHNKVTGDEGMIEIIGGSGKWKGATGTGTVRRKFLDGKRGSYEYELKMTMP